VSPKSDVPAAYVSPQVPATVRTINKLALPDWFSTATAGMRRVNGVSAAGDQGRGGAGGISVCSEPDQRCGAPTYSPANAIGIAYTPQI
jgi:hypothetical protein